MSDVRVKIETYIGFYCGNLREGDHTENTDVAGRVVLKEVFVK
jgi:hypothetical protein